MKSFVTLATILLFLAAVVSVPRSFAYANDTLPLTLSISGPATVRSGQAINITIVRKNISKAPVRIIEDASSQGEVTFGIDIHRGDGKPIPKTKYGRAVLDGEHAIHPTFYDLLPNETSEKYSVLSDIYDMNGLGTYVIQVIGGTGQPDDHTIILSNQLIVTVTP